MILRLLVGVGLLALGYYVGREVGRAEPVREELRKAREQKPGKGVASPPSPSATERGETLAIGIAFTAEIQFGLRADADCEFGVC